VPRGVPRRPIRIGLRGTSRVSRSVALWFNSAHHTGPRPRLRVCAPGNRTAISGFLCRAVLACFLLKRGCLNRRSSGVPQSERAGSAATWTEGPTHGDRRKSKPVKTANWSFTPARRWRTVVPVSGWAGRSLGAPAAIALCWLSLAACSNDASSEGEPGAGGDVGTGGEGTAGIEGIAGTQAPGSGGVPLGGAAGAETGGSAGTGGSGTGKTSVGGVGGTGAGGAGGAGTGGTGGTGVRAARLGAVASPRAVPGPRGAWAAPPAVPVATSAS